jgi:hypothetical protein
MVCREQHCKGLARMNFTSFILMAVRLSNDFALAERTQRKQCGASATSFSGNPYILKAD